MSGDLGDAVVLARRRGDLLLVLRGARQRRSAFVVVPGYSVLELAHALAERASDLRHARGAEEQQDDDEEDEDLGKPDSKGHKRTIAAGSVRPAGRGHVATMSADGRAEGPPFLRQGKEGTHLALLELKDLRVALEDGTEIVKGVDLAVDTDQIHAVMGPNGSGKSTLAYALMGHPAYQITGGQILFDGEDVTELGADLRAQRGLFLAFQYPHAIPGVTVTSFMRSAINAIRKARSGEDDPIPIPEFRKEMMAAMERLRIPKELAQRYVNDGFSGGEKKRVEILQMALLKPRIAVLDETDSGLDIDALKVVAGGVGELVGPDMGALVITHYQRILNYITPDFVHVFVDGKIVAEGGPELAHTLEAEGYEAFMPQKVES
jgi:Fe-S cluster assembly ATP-binding protein